MTHESSGVSQKKDEQKYKVSEIAILVEMMDSIVASRKYRPEIIQVQYTQLLGRVGFRISMHPELS